MKATPRQIALTSKLKDKGPLSGNDARELLQSLRTEGERQANVDLDALWGGKKPSGGLRYKPLADGPVRRLALLRGLYGNGEATEMVVSLMPSQEIEFREKGGKKRLRLSLEVVLTMAAKADSERAKAEKRTKGKRK